MNSSDKKTQRNEQLLSIGEKLTAARKAKGLSQTEVSEKIGCSQSCLSSLENGRKAFSTDIVLELIRLYGISYEYVFGKNTVVGSEKSSVDNSESLYDNLSLLRQLTEKAKSPELNRGIDEYMKMCIYLLFRVLYQQNPHNTDKIFSADSSNAEKAAKKIIIQTPEQLNSFIENCHINKKNLELPVERGSDLRKFISECEKLFDIK